MSFVVVAGTMKSNQAVRFYFSFPTQAELAQQQGMGNTQAAKAFLQSREEAAQRAFDRCQSDPAVMNCELCGNSARLRRAFTAPALRKTVCLSSPSADYHIFGKFFRNKCFSVVNNDYGKHLLREK